MAWGILLLAGLCEIGWAVLLKQTKGFTQLWPSVGFFAFMLASVYLLAVALKSLPLGTAYAVWTGIGAVGTVVLGIAFLGESADWRRIACVALIVAGIAGLKLLTPAKAEGAAGQIRRDRRDDLVQQSRGAMTVGPGADVGEVEGIALDGQEAADIVAILASPGVQGPAELGDDHVFSRGKPDPRAEERGGLTPAEPFLIVLVPAELEELDDERHIGDLDDPTRRARGRLEPHLGFELEAGP